MFSKTLLVAAFAAFAAAQSTVLTFTRVPNPVTDGQAQAITFATNDTTSPVSIILRKGASSNLDTIETLTTNAVGGQFIWTPRLSLPNGNDYALEIRQNNQVNYFGPFTVQGFVPSAATTSASNSSSTITSTGAVTTGTGSSAPRNTTMSRATLSTTKTTTVTTGTGAGFQSQTASPTGNAAVRDIQAGGAIAAILGFAAAALL